MITLGLSAFSHDSSACLLSDGRTLAASEEERFTRKKHTGDLPEQSMNRCVQDAGLTFNDVDNIAFFERPYLKFARVLLDHAAMYPFSLRRFLESMPQWLDQRLSIPDLLEELGLDKKMYFIPHHLSHAASAYYPSRFEEAALLTVDGVGEWSSVGRGVARGLDVRLNKEIRYPHSLGLLYTSVTTYLGFRAHGEEGKLMALAALGSPSRLDSFRKVLHLKDDGSFSLDGSYFAFRAGRRMWGPKFEAEFGAPRLSGAPFTQEHYDIAASAQKILEQAVLAICRDLHRETGLDRLCLAGGVALNCVTNQRIVEETPFRELFVQPAPGDSGAAVGAALFVQHALHKVKDRHAWTHTYFGPAFEERELLRAVKNSGFPYEKLEGSALCSRVAKELKEEKIVGWFQGKMEFGPRALGNRSILASACSGRTKDLLNLKVKDRDSFQPFAPIVPRERAAEFFHLDRASPFMLLAPRVREEKRSLLPAITHFDGTARVQTVEQSENARLHELLTEFGNLTGAPVLVNTSFNGHDEPIVLSPEDALQCFDRNGLDFLVLGELLVSRRKEGA
jgi:carbamoyltransferase